MGAQVRRREGALGGLWGACWLYFTCLEGSGRLKVSYCTRLEAQNVDKYLTFARFWDGRLRKAKSFVFYVSGRLWEAQSVVFYGSGSSKPRKIQDICPVLGRVGSTGAAVWRDLACLVFSRGSRLFAEKGAFPLKILTFRGGAENRPH